MLRGRELQCKALDGLLAQMRAERPGRSAARRSSGSREPHRRSSGPRLPLV